MRDPKLAHILVKHHSMIHDCFIKYNNHLDLHLDPVDQHLLLNVRRNVRLETITQGLSVFC